MARSPSCETYEACRDRLPNLDDPAPTRTPPSFPRETPSLRGVLWGISSLETMSEPQSSQAQWRSRARRTAGKINTAWWLEKLGVPVVVTALGLSCFILLARREMEIFPWTQTILVGVGALLVMAGLAWFLARRHFETPEQAMVRIEASMKLRNSLSAAQAGVAPWPEVPQKVDDGTNWYWPRLLVPLLASALFITGACLLPVSARTDPNAGPAEEPQAWKDLEADIETLAEDDTVQEEYLDELEERLEELRKQPEEDWFSHSSLEATDALKKAHGQEIENLERNLRKSERALNALQKHGDPRWARAPRDRLMKEFEDALQQMGNGAAKPNKELLEKLQQLDPENLGNLNQEQLDQLRENMKKHAGQCDQCEGGGNGQGQGNGGGDDWLDDMLNEGDQPGQDGGQPGQDGQDGEGPGNGGINRGPGTAPGVLGRLRDESRPARWRASSPRISAAPSPATC